MTPLTRGNLNNLSSKFYDSKLSFSGLSKHVEVFLEGTIREPSLQDLSFHYCDLGEIIFHVRDRTMPTKSYFVVLGSDLVLWTFDTVPKIDEIDMLLKGTSLSYYVNQAIWGLDIDPTKADIRFLCIQ